LTKDYYSGSDPEAAAATREILAAWEELVEQRIERDNEDQGF
jgi:hypothetical protein